MGLRTNLRRALARRLRSMADVLRTEPVEGDEVVTVDVPLAASPSDAEDEGLPKVDHHGQRLPEHLVEASHSREPVAVPTAGVLTEPVPTQPTQEEADALLMAGAAMLSGDLGPALRAEDRFDDVVVYPHRERTAPTATDPALQAIEAAVVDVLQTVYDPEIPVDIYELGLIYDVLVDDEGQVTVKMTLTSPNCPAAQSMPDEVDAKTRELEGVTDVDVQVVFDPPWTPEMMSEEARLELNL